MRIKMPQIRWAFAALTTLTISSPVFAFIEGNGTSGGGPGIFCPSSIAGQPSVQTLDIYEGRTNDGLVIPELPAPFKQQIANALQKLNFDFSLQIDLKNALTKVMGEASTYAPGVSIHVPPDLGKDDAVPYPTGCDIGAIGYYQSDSVLKVSADAYSPLSETQKAAFWLHEAFYMMVREFDGGSNDGSGPARSFVAHLLAANQSVQILSNFGRPGTYQILAAPYQQKDPMNLWTPRSGNESRFLKNGNSYLSDLSASSPTAYTPILLPAKGMSIEVRMDKLNDGFDASHLPSDSPSILFPDGLSCTGLTSPAKVLLDYKVVIVGGQVIMSATIPSDCGILKLTRPSSPAINDLPALPAGIFPEALGKNIELRIAGKLIATADLSSYLSVALPIYYLQDLNTKF